MEITKKVFENNQMEINLIYSHQEVVDNLISDKLEVVYLLKGRAKIIFYDGEVIELRKGAFLEIEPNRLHKVINTSKKGLWLTIYYK